MNNLTFPPWWVYAVPIAANAVIWFESQKDKRIAALCGIFMSVHMASSIFFGRVVWGAFARLAYPGSLNPLDTAHPVTPGGFSDRK